MLNMKSIISDHKKRILEENVATEEKPCHCRDKSNYPVNGRCNVKSIIYTAQVTPQEPLPSTATDTYMQQLTINIATQFSQTTANVINSTGSRKNKTNNSKITSGIGSCETTSKARFNNHTHSFRNRNESNATKLSKHFWNYLIYENKPHI